MSGEPAVVKDNVLCNQEIAENIDKQLRNQARGVAHSMERFKTLVVEAKHRCIYPMLGFKSWTAYIADVIGKEMHQLPIDDRRQIVALLGGEGMSNRAIADAVGVNEITVRRDWEQVRHDVAPDNVTGLDGKTYHPKPPTNEQKPRRRPITDELRYEIVKLFPRVKRLSSLATDGRIARNRQALIGYRSDLIRFRDTLTDLIDQLGGDVG